MIDESPELRLAVLTVLTREQQEGVPADIDTCGGRKGSLPRTTENEESERVREDLLCFQKS